MNAYRTGQYEEVTKVSRTYNILRARIWVAVRTVGLLSILPLCIGGMYWGMQVPGHFIFILVSSWITSGLAVVGFGDKK